MKFLSDFPSVCKGKIFLTAIFFYAISILWIPDNGFPKVHSGMPPLTPLQEAEYLLAMKRYSESIRAFEALLDTHEKREYAVRGLVRACMEAGMVDTGREILGTRLLKAEEPSDFLYGLGYWFFLDGQIKESTLYFEEALKANPNHALALNNLGAVLSGSGRYNEAEKKIKKALELNPSESMFFQNLFLVYRNAGKDKRYRREYQTHLDDGLSKLALGYGKVLARSLRQKAFGFYSKGKLGLALASFEEIAAIYKEINYIPGLTAAWFSLGLLHEEQGDVDRSMEFFRQILQISPDHIQARQRLRQLTIDLSDR